MGQSLFHIFGLPEFLDEINCGWPDYHHRHQQFYWEKQKTNRTFIWLYYNIIRNRNYWFLGLSPKIRNSKWYPDDSSNILQ
jgi:hypothetical protein